jgi:NAD(P)-dependent dehydrogenase (short-subunit alcohol dehydrogenase family)
MQDKPVALVTGANQRIGLQIAKDLVAHGFTVLVGPRNLERGQAATKEVGPEASPIQLLNGTFARSTSGTLGLVSTS